MGAPLDFHSLPVWGLFAMGTLKARIDISAQERTPGFLQRSCRRPFGLALGLVLAVPPGSSLFLEHIFNSLTKINHKFHSLCAMIYWQLKTKWPINALDICHQQAADLFYDLGHVAPSLRFLSGEFHPGWLICASVTGSLQLMQLLLCRRRSLSQVLMGQ